MAYQAEQGDRDRREESARLIAKAFGLRLIDIPEGGF